MQAIREARHYSEPAQEPKQEPTHAEHDDGLPDAAAEPLELGGGAGGAGGGAAGGAGGGAAGGERAAARAGGDRRREPS